MRVSLSMDSSAAIKKLEALQARIPQAIAEGLNAGGDKVRTQVQKALQRQTGLVRLNSVTSRVVTLRAFPGQAEGLMTYRMIVKGNPHTKPSEFKYSVVKGPGGGVTVGVWGTPHKFVRSFSLYGKAAEGLRARTSDKRFPIRSFDGPNLAKEALVGEAKDAFVSGSERLVMPEIEKKLARVLR